jgi:hypothetical protein
MSTTEDRHRVIAVYRNKNAIFSVTNDRDVSHELCHVSMYPISSFLLFVEVHHGDERAHCCFV